MSHFDKLDESQDDVPLPFAERLLAYEQGCKSPSPCPLPGSIREELACVDLLHRVWPDIDVPGSPHCPPTEGDTELPPQQLGDFRILGELGRGGMGVVYEAEQLSLGRRVALKVLPFAAMLDRQQLARFKNEARAAATLDHPNIVAIHSVGCERSVHFYAMQLIEGRSLAEVIAHLKPGCPPSAEEAAPAADFASRPAADDTAKAALPTVQTGGSTAFSSIPSVKSRDYYRNAARLGIQAAEALDHAHRNGILHRDIKPANLLVDDAGKLWITDFGLARVEADAGMTMTGDLLGTLRYMSPEQALAQRVVVDHRTDIYSLGATLYELLTLEPAFAENDRAKLLQQIAYEEPRPLRKIDERIPAELETIALTAMAKHREERYQTAEQLADDLRAFLENRPIKARSPGLPHRMAKWSRRHQTLVSTAAVALVLLSAILAVSMVKVQSAKTLALAALDETADLLYTTDMTLAYQTHEKGWSDEVQAILDRHRPSKGGPDRRGFEWHLLQTLAQQPASVTLAAHSGPVNELAVFPDRRRLASVGSDGTLRIWDTHDGKLVRSVSVCDEELHSVAISPDGRYIAAGSTALYLYDTVKADVAKKLIDFEYTVESLAFSPDGDHIALGTRYDELCLVSREGQMIKRMPSRSRLESLEFMPTTHRLLVPHREIVSDARKLGTARVLHADLSGVVPELDATEDIRPADITAARSSPCGRFVIAGEERNSRAHLFDFQASRIIAQTPVSRDRLRDLCYSPDGKSIAIGYRDGQVEIFGVRPDAEIQPLIVGRPRVLSAHPGEVKCVRFIDAATLATCGVDGCIRIWRLSANSAALTLNMGEMRMNSMALSPDGRRLLSVGKNEFLIVETDTGRVVFRCSKPDAGYTGAEWSLSGKRAAVGSCNENWVRLLDPTGRTICQISHGGGVGSFAFSPDESRIVITGANQLQVASTADGRSLDRRLLPADGAAAAFSHDGRLIACGGHFGGILLFDAHLQPVREFACESSVRCLRFSPNDSLLATGHGDSAIRVWETDTGRLRGEFVGHERSVTCLAFSPDGRTLLSAGSDSAGRLWSIEHSRGLGSFYRRALRVALGESCQLSLTPNGRHLTIGYSLPRDGLPDLLLWQIDASASD